MQNLERFRTTSDFYSEYLRNRWISEIGKLSDRQNFENKLHWYCWKSNKSFRNTGFFLKTDGNRKHMF